MARCLSKFMQTSPVIKRVMNTIQANPQQKSLVKNALKSLHDETKSFVADWNGHDPAPKTTNVIAAFPEEFKMLVDKCAERDDLAEAIAKPGAHRRAPQQQNEKTVDPRSKNIFFTLEKDMDSPPLALANVNRPTTTDNFPIKLLTHALQAIDLRKQRSKSTRLYFNQYKTHLAEHKFNAISSRLQMHNSFYWKVLNQMRCRNYFRESREQDSYTCSNCLDSCPTDDSAYHRMIQCVAYNGQRTQAAMAALGKLRKLGFTRELATAGARHAKATARMNTLKDELALKYQPLDQVKLFSNGVTCRNIEYYARTIGLDIQNEYKYVTKLHGRKRNEQVLNLAKKIERRNAKLNVLDQDSCDALTDPKTVLMYHATKEALGDTFAVQLLRNTANVNQILKDLCPSPDRLGELICPNPNRNSTLAQIIKYALCYYIVWFTSGEGNKNR